MTTLGLAAKLIFGLVLAFFVFLGFTTEAWEGDSLAYHLPIAQRLLNGDFLRRETFTDNFYYYPASGELILALFMNFGIPLNLYNVAAWVWLFWVGYRLARKWGLSKGAAEVFAGAVCMLTTTVRLLPTQTIDIWLAVFWGESLLLLLSPRPGWRYWVKLGTALGLLAGVKFSGVIYAALLVVFFGWRLLWNRSYVRGWVVAGIAATLFGLGWYIRNWVFTGELMPLPYPTTITRWVQNADPDLPIVWRVIAYHPGGGRLFVENLVSEYLMWAVAPFIIWFTRNKLGILGGLMFWMYLFMPAGPGNMLSDFRYVIPAFMAMMLVLFKEAEDRGWGEKLGVLAVANMTAVIPQLEFRPKLFAGYLALAAGWVWKGERHEVKR